MKFDVVKYIDGRVQRFAFAKPLVTRKPFTFSQSPQAIPGMIGQDKVLDGSELRLSEIAGKTVKASEKLPSGYTEVEYLQNGQNAANLYRNCRIETGVMWKSLTKVVINLDIVRNSDNGKNIILCGKGTSVTPNAPYICFSSPDISGISVTHRSIQNDELTVIFTSTNETEVVISGWSDSVYAGIYKIKRVKFYADNNTLACEFIPCKRNNDNMPGMYDVVRGQFFQNAGTGEFITGDDVFTLKSAEVSGVQVNGANLWDEEWELGSINVETGETISDNTRIRSKNYIPVLPNTTYYFYRGGNTVSFAWQVFYDENKNFILSSTKTNNTFVTPANAVFMRFHITSTYGTTYNHDIAIVLGSTGTYKSYRAPWLFDLGQTVTLNGVGSVGDKISIVAKENGLFDVVKTTAFGDLDLTTVDWSVVRLFGGAYGFYASQYPQNAKGAPDNEKANILCSIYDVISANTASAGSRTGIGMSSAWEKFFVFDQSVPTAPEMKQKMQGVHLIYELATPTTATLLSDLTRDEITALVETYGSIEIVGNDNQQFVQPTVTVNIDAQSQTEIQKFGVDIPKPADPVFANNDWPTILSNFKKGTAPATWQVGDTKPLTLTDGTTYTIRLCDKQEGRYDYSDGSGSSKAVFEFVELVKVGSTNRFSMNTTTTNTGGWADCYMRGTNIPSIEALIPSNVLAAISEVNVLSGTGGGSTSGTSSSANKLFLPAEMEMFSAKIYSIGNEECLLGQFDYYKAHNTNADRIKKDVGTTTAVRYWLRSPYSFFSSSFCIMKFDGSADTPRDASYSYGISPIFAV